MADAKIINYGQPIGAGSTAIPDNTSVALDIESTDAKDYITLNTTDGSELITLGSKTLVKGDLLDEMTGTVEIESGTLNTLVGSGTAFLTEIFEGSAVKVDGQIFSVVSVASNTSAVLDSNASGAVAASTKIYADNSPIFQVQSGDSRTLLEANNHYVRINGRGGPSDDSPTHDEVALYIDGGNTVSGNTDSNVVEINAAGSNGSALWFSESGSLKGRITCQQSRMLIQTEGSSGDMRIRPGNSANMLILDAGTMDATWQDADVIMQANSTSTGDAADKLIFHKSNNNTDGSHTIVADNDVLGTVEFKGSDGDSFESGAKIFARVNGTPSAGTDMPTELVFSTSAEASATPAERLQITAAGTTQTIGGFAGTGSGTVGTGGSSDATLEQASASTFQTQLHVGAAIRIVDSGDGEVFLRTVASITDANTLEMDEAATIQAGSSWTYDSGELFAVKTGDSKTLLGVNETGAIQMGSSAADNDGSNNIAIGDSDALDLVSQQVSTTNGTRNYVIGHASDNYKISTGYRNILVGYSAGEDITTAHSNVIIGDSAGSVCNDQENVYVGSGSGLVCTGQKNTAIGNQSCRAAGAADKSVAVGYNALYANVNDQNTGVGYQAGASLTTGENCTFLGADSTTSEAGLDNQMALGYAASTDAANQVRLGNTSVDDIDGQVALTATSDARTKDNVEDLETGLDFINALRPVSFTRKHPADWPEEIREERYKQGRPEMIQLYDDSGKYVGDEINMVSSDTFDVETNQPIKGTSFNSTARSDGLLAQEVQVACETLGVSFNGIKESKNGKLGIQYSLLVAPLIKAVQELSARVAELEAGD